LKKAADSIIMSLLLGSRPMAGHMTLDHGIGVRIPASQSLSEIVFYQQLVKLSKTLVAESLYKTENPRKKSTPGCQKIPSGAII
jgi:hypothetical protein